MVDATRVLNSIRPFETAKRSCLRPLAPPFLLSGRHDLGLPRVGPGPALPSALLRQIVFTPHVAPPRPASHTTDGFE